MSPAEFEFILNLSASCTVDQAVLRLLGWGQDNIYRTIVEQSGDDKLLENNLKSYRPGLGLNEYLTELFKQAVLKYTEAAPEDATEEEMRSAEENNFNRIKLIKTLIANARWRKMDIVDELAKGEGSALRLDKDATAHSGVAHITLRSLDAWNDATYSVKQDATGNAPESNLHALLEKITDVDGAEKSNFSLYVTLALAVQAFAEKAGPKYLRSDDDVNVKQIAEHLALLGAKLRPQGGNLPGQSEASIRGRINSALTHHRTLKIP